MIYRSLGATGLQVSALALGSGMSTLGEMVDPSTYESLMQLAHEQGVNFFDTAENYGMGQAPRLLGELLRRLRWPRSSYVLLSKVFYGGRDPSQVGLSAKRVRESCDRALQDLGVDHLDVFLCHFFDRKTPLEETVFAMHQLVLAGKVLYWGTSNWEAHQIQAAIDVARAEGLRPPSLHQPGYSLMNRAAVEGPLKELVTRHGLGLVTYSPLNCGYLSGKYAEGASPPGTRLALPRFLETRRELLEGPRAQEYVKLITLLQNLARELGCTPAQLSIAWCLMNPQVSSVVLGATKPAQLAENLGALAVAERLPPEYMAALDRAAMEMPS